MTTFTLNRPIKTPMGELMYVFIKGEGRNTAMAGQPERMQYVASIRFKEGSPEHKEFEAQLWDLWREYQEKTGFKGKPAKTDKGEYMIGLKKEYISEGSGEIDPETGQVRKIPSGYVLANFKTNTTWADGNPKVVKVFDFKGRDITEAYQNVDWAIGNGTIGKIYGVASANNAGGKHKISLYLSGVQIIKNLQKYSPDGIADVDQYDDGEEIDFNESTSDAENVEKVIDARDLL